MNTMRFRFLLACLALAAFATACGPKVTIPTPAIDGPSPDKALITFVRATKFGYKSDFHLWDSTDYVGTIYGGQYIQKEVEPGEHMFIAHGQNWAYIKADLEAGKKYYILLNVSMGFSHAAVIPVPITRVGEYNQDNINEWMASLTSVGPNPEVADAFVAKRAEQVERAVANGEAPDAKFQTLSAEDYWD